MQDLDRTDRHLLRLMQEDAARPVADLADAVGVSAGACWRRIERLEAAGIILGRRVRVDLRRLGYEVQVFLRVTLDKTQGNAIDRFMAEARQIPHVLAIETLLGLVDLCLDVIARVLGHYHESYRT